MKGTTMFRKTFTGSLVAASLTASALMSMSTATAAPTYLSPNSPSGVGTGTVPSSADVVMSENGTGVAAWLREVNGKQVVQASHFAGGASGVWSPPATVSPANAEVANPTVAINDKGVAVAAWMQKDDQDHYQVRVNRFVSGAFGVSQQVSVGTTYDAVNEMDAAVDGSGRFWAAYQVTDGGTVNRIRVLHDNGAGQYGEQFSNLGDDSAFAPDLAVNAQGEALLAWYNAGNGSSTIDVRRYNPASGLWTATESVLTSGQYRVEAETALNDAGQGSVAYAVADLSGDYRATVSRVGDDGNPINATYVSPDGLDSDHVSLDQNDHGAAVLAWNQEGGEVGYKTRSTFTNGWASGSAVAAALSGPTFPKAAISDAGQYILGWTDGGDLKSAYRGSAVLPFVKYSSEAIDFDTDDTSVGIDNQGNAVLGGVYHLPNPAQGALHVKFVDAGGPTSTMGAVPANTLSGKAKLTWSASDRFSDVTAYDVRVKTTAWNSTVGKYTSLQTGGPATSLDFTAAPGRTYCFEVRARDAHANYGAYTAPKCTTTPVDDRAGVIAKGFKRAKAATSYRGTYSIAKKKNAVMSFQHVKASRIAVLVTKLPKGGKIQVKFAGKVLGTYSLKGSGNQKLVAAKNFGSVKNGTLVIKVVSKTGKVVRIDGVVIAK